MNSAKVESILARCMLDPSFLDILERDPQKALDQYELDPGVAAEFVTLNWNRVRSVAGIITKVQNNGLWQHFQYTRALLAHYKLDLQLFSLFRGQHLRNRASGISRDAQTLTFLQFLSSFITSLPTEYPGLIAIMQHEQWTWEINKALSQDVPRSLPHQGRTSRALPKLKVTDVLSINGAIRAGQFKHDPITVAEMLRGETFDGKRIAERSTWRCYWGMPVIHDLRIFAVTEESAKILMRVDGRRCVKEILSRTKSMTVNDLLVVLHQGVEMGLLSRSTNATH